MIRWIAVLALAAGVSACRDTSEAISPAAFPSEPCADVRFHGDLQENGCVYEVQELAVREGLDAAPVWVFYGYLHKHADGFRLHVKDDPHAAFMALDLTKLPESEVPYGLEPLISWRTRIIGYYTSADVATPSISDATGTLRVLSIGYIGDPARPRGAYDTVAREAAKADAEVKAETEP